jgi:AcrR family transcriptional regulator
MTSWMHERAHRDTRERIRVTAARSFAEHGYHRTCLRSVAREVGIQKASIFHHFASKELLYQAVIDEGHGEIEAMIGRALTTEGGWWPRLRALLEGYVDLVASHPEQTRILVRQSLGDAPEGYDGHADSERLLTMVIRFLADGRRAGAFASVDGPSFVLGIVGMVTFLFTSARVVSPHWGRGWPSGTQVAQLRRHVTTLVVRALEPRAFAGGPPARRATIAAMPTPADPRDARDA